MAETNERSAVLIVRAWVERGQTSSFRARIIESTDSARTEQTIVTSADPLAVLAAVQTWLEALLQDWSRPPPRSA